MKMNQFGKVTKTPCNKYYHLKSLKFTINIDKKLKKQYGLSFSINFFKCTETVTTA